MFLKANPAGARQGGTCNKGLIQTQLQKGTHCTVESHSVHPDFALQKEGTLFLF